MRTASILRRRRRSAALRSSAERARSGYPASGGAGFSFDIVCRRLDGVAGPSMARVLCQKVSVICRPHFDESLSRLENDGERTFRTQRCRNWSLSMYVAVRGVREPDSPDLDDGFVAETDPRDALNVVD